MEVRMIRLATGEEVVFGVESEDDTTVKMKDPMAIRVRPQSETSYSIMLVPFSPTVISGTHTLFKHHVVSTASVPNEVEKEYLQQTSGIEIVTSL